MQNSPSDRLGKALASIEVWLGLLFKPDTPKQHPTLSRSWLAGLFIAGIVIWGFFFNWGAFPLTLKDWGNITGPRLALLQDALKKGVLPLHISNTLPQWGVTDRYLSVPDQILSPQAMMMRFSSITRFVFVDVILLYLAGFLGLLWFMRKFSLSLVAFTILFLLFNFNGYILAHFSIGHLSFGGYYFFPWFAALVFRLADGERGWGWIAKMALLLLAMYLQGSFHMFAWCLLFLAFLALIRRNALWTVVGGASFAILISMVRILPTAIIYPQLARSFVGGYQGLGDVWYALVNMLQPGEGATVPMMAQLVQRWELTMYVGLAGALFLVFFGIYRWLKGENGRIPYLGLAVPIFATFLASFDIFYRWVRVLGIPLLEGERVSSRIISLPFVFILLIAVSEFQRWLNQPHKNERLLYLAAIGLIAVGGHDLWIDFKAWLPSRVGKVYPVVNFQRSAYFVTNHSDPPYLTALIIGAVISLLSLAVLLWLAYRRRRRETPAYCSVKSDPIN